MTPDQMQEAARVAAAAHASEAGRCADSDRQICSIKAHRAACNAYVRQRLH